MCQMLVVMHHLYEISVSFIVQTSFRKETSGWYHEMSAVVAGYFLTFDTLPSFAPLTDKYDNGKIYDA